MDRDKLTYRHELKYVVTETQCALLKARIQPLMRPDPHAGPDGQYAVRSLYFDSEDNRCYYESQNGTDPREKFRLRIYNGSSDFIRLECKRKERGKTAKLAAPLSPQLAQALLEGQAPRLDGLPPLARELLLERLRPAVIVEYTRIPFLYPLGNVRVTFDVGISSAPPGAGFFAERLPRRPVMPSGRHILEVKFDEFLPDFLYRALNLGTLQQTAFSKYYLCRRLSL